MLSSEEANRRYFREAYRTGQHGWAVEEPDPYAVRFLERLAREVPHATLLDVGCGEGRHSIAAARMGFWAIGVDYEPLALDRARRFAREEGIENVRYRRGNVFDLPFRAGVFDIVLDYGCLHHQRKADWPAYRASILRVLKPGGFYVLSVFSPRFCFFRGSKRQWHIAYGAYRRCFTARDIESLFAQDFELLERIEERGEGGGFWHVLMRAAGG